jgi:hypothetical protein
VKPAVSENYCGNAVIVANAGATVKEILEEKLSNTANRIRKAVDEMNGEFIQKCLDFLLSLPDKREVYIGPDLNDNGFALTSWVKFPMYECDFGWGRPAYAGPDPHPWPPGHGATFSLPPTTSRGADGAAGDGGMVLMLSLRREDMIRFEQDEEVNRLTGKL